MSTSTETDPNKNCTGDCTSLGACDCTDQAKPADGFDKQARVEAAMRTLAELLTGVAQAYAMVAQSQTNEVYFDEASFNKASTERYNADRFGNLVNGFAHGLCFLSGSTSGDLTMNGDGGQLTIKLVLTRPSGAALGGPVQQDLPLGGN